jgi:hypothetical protein
VEENPRETESGAKHQEVPKDDAAVETDRAPNKRHRGRNVAADTAVSRRTGRGEIVDPRRNLMPPAGR